jgi:dephospho-CoA kinase
LLKVGLTGGIASGKTSVGEMFVALGAQLIQADEISHQLMQPGQDVYTAVVRNFGAEILDADGKVNRRKLAEAAFGSGDVRSGDAGSGDGEKKSSRIQELNAIVHPAVIRRQEEWMEEVGRRDQHSIAIVEAALLLEAGVADHFDRMIVVTCLPEQRVERWARRMQVDHESARREVMRRMAAQLPDQEKIECADDVIDNSGSLDKTREQVGEIYRKLREQAG